MPRKKSLHHKISMAVIFSILALASRPALAQNDNLSPQPGPCQLDLSADNSVDWRGTYGRGYEIFDTDSSYESFSVMVEHKGAPCEFFLTASPISGGGDSTLNGPDGSLTYDILKTTSGPSFLSRDFLGDQTSRIAGRFPGGRGVRAANLFLSIPKGQFVRGGRYQGQAMVRLFRMTRDTPELVAETPVAIIAPVASVLKVRSDYVPEGTRETAIDLGDLSTGQRRSLGFEVVTNADIAVTFQSSNNGKLMHNFGAPGIKYDLQFSGQLMDLSGQTATRRIFSPSAKSRHSMPLEISVPRPQYLPAAGEYRDVLTVTFTAD